MPKNISPSRVRELLDYDPLSGQIRWRVTRGRCVGGSTAGTISPYGYLIVMIDGVGYRGHWLAWAHYHGQWPKDIIDHDNRQRADNRLVNLREATCGQNRANSRKNRTNALPKGVFTRGRKFGAQIVCNRKNHYLGLFLTAAEAHSAYFEAARRLHGEFARAE